MLDYNKYIPTDRETEFVGNLINIQPNDISYIFFSTTNSEKINNMIIEIIKEITFERYGKKIIIEKQSKHILLTIMRHVYLRNVKNNEETEIEVSKLNNEVLRLTVPTVLNGLLSQMRYINDYNTIRPMDLPVSSSRNNDAMGPLVDMFI